MDIGIGGSYLFVRPKEGENENGLGDTEIKVKYRLFDEKDWVPAFAIAGNVKIPTASESRGLGSGKTDFGINTIAHEEPQQEVRCSISTWGTLSLENME